MKFPSMEEMAKEVAEKALDEYEYQGKTIRQWVDILKDYDDKQTTLQRIVERLEEEKEKSLKLWDGGSRTKGYETAIKIVKKEGL